MPIAFHNGLSTWTVTSNVQKYLFSIKLTDKGVRSVVTRNMDKARGTGEGELDEVSQKEQIFSYKIKIL